MTGTLSRPVHESSLARSLREAPATLPALVAIALLIVWATDQAGYPVTHWAPGALIVLGLVALAVALVGVRIADIPLPVRIALGCLAAYTALSFASILWAAVPGDAWEGANRTLLYLLVFALFACWPQRGASAALLLVLWTLALVGLAAFTLLHLSAATGEALVRLIPGGRLTYPSGYANSNAAQWLMAFWPALLLARSRSLPSALRGALAGGAVLLAEVALLSQSRGSLYATPVMLVLVFALVPGRTRTFAVLVPVAMGIGAAAPAVLRVHDRIEHPGAESAVHSATTATLLAALGVALVVALGAAVERRRGLSAAWSRRVHRGTAAVAVATLVALLGGGWAAAGDPIARARHAWDTFTSPSGYEANSSGSRLTSGLGSTRYDFYRVALDEFAAHPVLGIGADNFQQPYLRRRHSDETPHYPHSVELRTLSQTGAVGALLALAGLAAALLAGARAVRSRGDPLGGVVAAAALGGFAYWVVHGSFDWFWEFAGLGASAFALLGMACSLAPRARRRDEVAEALLASSASLGSDAARPGAASAEGHPEPGAILAGVPSAAAVEGDLRPPAVPQSEAPQSEPPPARALGAPAHAADAPRPPARQRLRSGGSRRLARRFGFIAVLVLALAGAASLAAPWLSQLEVQSAAKIWMTAPRQAYARLDDAASLNPLSDEAYLVAGNIALRYGDLPRADHEFALALARTPGDSYATLELGAIASARGQRATALQLLQRAVGLDPRDSLTREVLSVVRRGRRVDLQELNDAILRKGEQLA